MALQVLKEGVRTRLQSGVAITSVAQCVEELVENCIDAGASCIAVRIDLSRYKMQVHCVCTYKVCDCRSRISYARVHVVLLQSQQGQQKTKILPQIVCLLRLYNHVPFGALTIAHAITWPFAMQLFPNCTQTHVFT